MYLVNTKPYLCFVVSTLAHFMCEPRQMHWVVAKHVLRYLCGTIRYGLRYTSSTYMTLVGYLDFESAGSVEDWKSTSRCCFGLGSTMVSWFSRKQSSVALSTTEAKYILACMAAREAMWL